MALVGLPHATSSPPCCLAEEAVFSYMGYLTVCWISGGTIKHLSIIRCEEKALPFCLRWIIKLCCQTKAKKPCGSFLLTWPANPPKWAHPPQKPTFFKVNRMFLIALKVTIFSTTTTPPPDPGIPVLVLGNIGIKYVLFPSLFAPPSLG